MKGKLALIKKKKKQGNDLNALQGVKNRNYRK